MLLPKPCIRRLRVARTDRNTARPGRGEVTEHYCRKLAFPGPSIRALTQDSERVPRITQMRLLLQPAECVQQRDLAAWALTFPPRVGTRR